MRLGLRASLPFLVVLVAACGAPPDPGQGAGQKLVPDPAAPPDGAAIVAREGCARCHQDDAARPLAGRSSAPPYGPNLTPDADTGLGGWSDEQILAAIRAGTDDGGHELCAVMPRFSALSDDDARALVRYLRGLVAVAREVPETECE